MLTWYKTTKQIQHDALLCKWFQQYMILTGWTTPFWSHYTSGQQLYWCGVFNLMHIFLHSWHTLDLDRSSVAVLSFPFKSSTVSASVGVSSILKWSYLLLFKEQNMFVHYGVILPQNQFFSQSSPFGVKRITSASSTHHLDQQCLGFALGKVHSSEKHCYSS